MKFSDLNAYAQQMEDGRWVLASWVHCAGEWYAVPGSTERPVTALTLERLVAKKGVRAYPTREEAVRAAWIVSRHRGSGGEWLEQFRDDDSTVLLYETEGGEGGWLWFELTSELPRWMRWQVSEDFLQSRGFRGEVLERFRTLEPQIPDLNEDSTVEEWRCLIRTWLAEFEKVAAGTRLGRRHRILGVEQLAAQPDLVAHFTEHLGRLARPPVAPQNDLAEFEAMLCDLFDEPGCWMTPADQEEWRRSRETAARRNN
jgi:hypothetical protein